MSAPNPNRVLALANGFRESRIILTAYEIKLFDCIESGRTSVSDVSTELKTDPRATRILLDALTSIELLIKTGDAYTNAPETKEFLVSSSPKYMFGLMHTVNLWETWSSLTSVVRSGKCLPRNPINERGDSWLNAFIDAMHWRAASTAPTIVKMIGVNGVTKVLDLGGGSGAFAMEFARANPAVHAVVYDLPNVVPIAQKYISAEMMSERVSTQFGDYHVDELGDGYDLAFLSNVIHSNSHDENQRIIHKCFGALNGGGRIVLQDFVLEESRTSPVHAALFAINMLVGTEQGDSYTMAEISGWLSNAGFVNINRLDTPFGSALISAVKKA